MNIDQPHPQPASSPTAIATLEDNGEATMESDMNNNQLLTCPANSPARPTLLVGLAWQASSAGRALPTLQD
ncbi:hypothetical protein OH76DRAFT_1403714 [Lentinus brumalis]|uniref:Uncharacterized protein n=1 Tax=Lentinus brumalis TaxID=2498619 RepID=A0A371DAC0_9APHY|nr:hypothetical protein OH76DRAFT_1403714 [Polyporus brumalis]